MDAVRKTRSVPAEARFSAELFLSTDGKHTVHITADTPEGRKAGRRWAVRCYRRIVSSLGTQPQMWAGVQPKAGKPLPARRRGDCPHPGKVVRAVRKDGPNHGRPYFACRDCGEFLGWTTAP